MINRLLAYLASTSTAICWRAGRGAAGASGLLTLYSASGESFERVAAQLANIAWRLVVMWIAANVPPHYLPRHGAAGLCGRPDPADRGRAVRRESSTARAAGCIVGFTRIQPSELMKIAVPLMLAWYFDRYEAILKLRDFAVGAVLVLVPVLLIAKQPDLGTALLIAAAGFFVIFLAGLVAGRFWSGSAVAAVRQPAVPVVDAARLPAPARADPARSVPGSARRRAITPSSPPSRWARADSSAKAGSTARRRISISCRSAPPTSFSRCSPKSSACSATWSC